MWHVYPYNSFWKSSDVTKRHRINYVTQNSNAVTALIFKYFKVKSSLYVYFQFWRIKLYPRKGRKTKAISRNLKGVRDFNKISKISLKVDGIDAIGDFWESTLGAKCDSSSKYTETMYTYIFFIYPGISAQAYYSTYDAIVFGSWGTYSKVNTAERGWRENQ